MHSSCSIKLSGNRGTSTLALRLVQSNNCRTTALHFFAEKFARACEKTVGTRKYFSGTPISLAVAWRYVPDPF